MPTRMMTGLMTLALGATIATSAAADVSAMTRGYIYFNKPGADGAAHTAAVSACVEESAAARSFVSRTASDPNTSPPPAGVVSALFWGSRFNSGHLGTAMSAIENCMVVRGWRVIRLSDREGRAMAGMRQADLMAALEPWIGAEAPHGAVARIWSNEAADSAGRRFAELPPVSEDGMLSLKAVTGRDAGQFTDRVQVHPGPLPAFSYVRAVSAADARIPVSGQGIILASVRGLSVRNGFGILLRNEDTQHPLTIGLDRSLPAFTPDQVYAFRVPAGRWRVAGMISNSNQYLDFCWGAPAFQVESGRLVWAGAFDLNAANLKPDLDLTAPRRWLAGSPDGVDLVPAVFVNGSTAACDGSTLYSLTFP